MCFHGKKRPLFRLMRAAAPVIVSPFHISRIALVKTMLLALPTDVHFPRRVLNTVRIQESYSVLYLSAHTLEFGIDVKSE